MERVISIPKPTLERLPLYYRRLLQWREEKVSIVSSADIGKNLGIDSAQVRRDLTYFGAVGRPGIGYKVEELISYLGELLGLNNVNEAIIVGIGNLGRAICSYPGFTPYGLSVVAFFDVDPQIVGTNIRGREIFHVNDLIHIVKRLKIQIGIITVPAREAQKVADLMVAGGIRAIWNFAPTRLHVPEDIIIRSEDLAVGLATLSHYLVREDLPERAEGFDRGISGS
jgi:redox-sensing transcriptional repressor